MFKRILSCEYDFVSPWWDDVSLNAKDLVSKARMRQVLSISATEKESILGWRQNNWLISCS